MWPFQRRITANRVKSDFSFLVDGEGFTLIELNVPGINDVLVARYSSSEGKIMTIVRDRGYWEMKYGGPNSEKDIFDIIKELGWQAEDWPSRGVAQYEYILETIKTYLSKRHIGR